MIYRKFLLRMLPYGFSGEAVPWYTKSGEKLSDGGADPKWLPLSVDNFVNIGIFKRDNYDIR